MFVLQTAWDNKYYNNQLIEGYNIIIIIFKIDQNMLGV